MALLPSPARLRRALSRKAAAVARRLLGIQQEPQGELRKVPDDLPRDGLFDQPLICDVTGSAETHDDDDHRVAFKVTVKDAAGKRCPDLFVEAEVSGPERTVVGDTTTSLLGTATFRMPGPAGTYEIRVTDVAAGALLWDRETSTTHLEVTIP